MLSNSASDIQCGSLISNCESCFIQSNGICGWCADYNDCFVGNSDGPYNNTCSDWSFKFDMKCHLQSMKPASKGVRIGILVFCSIIAFGTAIFWICIYPICFSPKTDEDSHPEYNAH
ncbi:hypothetical protein M9Y10_043548 [Tritrichomonas musculus]|uniref:Plexin repeat family protein n=1 Tax=Tritrichomonas musculus TaxID=1915356 RepID=A0ABR2K021_9EUKA